MYFWFSVKRQGLRSASSFDSDYDVPFNKRKTFSDRSFGTVGPKLWNQLPMDIRQSQYLDVFKRKLKSYLFSNFYSLF